MFGILQKIGTMSRKSENSAAGSAGDAESMISSRESSPRKLTDLGTRGPFGDFFTNDSNYFVLKANDELLSTDEEDDEESGALKREYLTRLKLIREKLAGIDIANKNYYNNCFIYPPQDTSQCRITEIFDNNENTKQSANRNESSGNSSKESVSVEHVTYENESLQIPKENKISSADSNHLIQNGSPTFKSETVTNLDPDSENIFQRDIKVSMPPQMTDSLKESQLDIKPLFSYDCLIQHDQSSAKELLELNYNPPKKKPCVRESTPKLVLSEGSIPLPYHIRVSLHEDISKAAKQASNECNLYKTVQEPIDHCIEKVKEEEEIRNEKHFTANSQINGIPPKSTKQSTEELSENIPQNGLQTKSKKSPGNDKTYVLFLDTLTQSSSASPKSNVTLMTSTTASVESLSRLRKKRRIFLRTARNKVKPIDSLSLWEEIRTMEAVNKHRCLESASSKETFFGAILLDKVVDDEAINANFLGSLDVPRKSSLTFKSPIRFPSITKITKFCSSAFGRKAENVVENNTKCAEVQKEDVRPLNAQKVANTLLNLKQEQKLHFENDDCTPNGEIHSEFDYTNSEEDIDAYYQPFCLFCFCF